jgi:hypothetical protein
MEEGLFMHLHDDVALCKSTVQLEVTFKRGPCKQFKYIVE